MSLRPFYYPIVRVIDIDGTIIKKREEYYGQGREDAKVLDGSLDLINQWFDNGDYIIFWTARSSQYKDETVKELDSLGFHYHQLLMDKPYTHQMFIYDDNPITAVRVERNVGIGGKEKEK